MNSDDGKARIVIADDCAAVRKQLEIVLRGDFDIVGQARDGIELLDMVEKLEPDVVIVDINMPGMDGIEATRRIVDRLPGTAVVVISVETEIGFIRKAMAAGAREYLFKPSEPDEIREVIYRITRDQRQRREILDRQERGTPGAGVWSFCGATGGDGRTTLVLGLASELRSLGRSVAVVDLDLLFGDISFYLGIPNTPVNLLSYQESERVDGGVGALDFMHAHESGIKLIGPPRRPVDACLVTPESILDLVRELEKAVDYVLVDMPAGFPEEHLKILDRSRFVFPVGSDGVGSLKNLKIMTKLLAELGYAETKVCPLISRVDDAGATAKLLAAANLRITRTFPLDREAVDQAIRCGQPVTCVAPRSEFTIEVRRFLLSFLDISAGDEEKETSGNFLQRLVSWAA